MQQRVLEENKEKVRVRWNSEVREVIGDGQRVTGIVVEDTREHKKESLPAEGVFVAIGHAPMTAFLDDELRLNKKGYVVTRLSLDEDSVREAQGHLAQDGLVRFPTMTSVEGVFAAGDVVDFRYRQAVTAAGMGTMAALDAEWWLERGQS